MDKTGAYVWNPKAVIIDGIFYQAESWVYESAEYKIHVRIKATDTVTGRAFYIDRHGKIDSHGMAILTINKVKVAFGVESGGLYSLKKDDK